MRFQIKRVSARPFLAGLPVAAGALLVAGACSKAPARPQRAPIAVNVTKVQRRSVPYEINANGIVTPMQTAVVASQVTGIITDVKFTEGQEVAKGDVLFQMDPRLYKAAYDQAVAALARDKATAAYARQQVVRYSALATQGIVTQEQLGQLRATADAAAATEQADEATIATAKFNVDNTVIRAPISGRTGSLLVRTGNLVQGGSGAALVVINQVRPILVRFAVPGGQLPLILKHGEKDGQLVGLPVTAAPGSLLAGTAAGDTATPMDEAGTAGSPARTVAPMASDPDARGELSMIDNAVDTTTATIMLKGTFPNRRGSLWPGQFVATTLRLFVEDSVLVLPTQAVVTGQQGTYVYVIDSSNTAQQRPVTVERAAGEISVIASGLSEGERVVTDGQSRVTPGTQVTIGLHDNGAADAAGAAGGSRGGHGGRSGRGGRSGHGRGDTTVAKPN